MVPGSHCKAPSEEKAVMKTETTVDKKGPTRLGAAASVPSGLQESMFLTSQSVGSEEPKTAGLILGTPARPSLPSRVSHLRDRLTTTACYRNLHRKITDSSFMPCQGQRT